MKIFVRSLDANTDKVLYRNLPKTGSRQDIHQKMNEQTDTSENGLLFRNNDLCGNRNRYVYLDSAIHSK